MKQKRIKDSQKSYEDILNAAEIEFSEKGIHGARVDQIADRANINKRMIYQYFGSKEELYKAVLVEVYSRLSKKEIYLLSEEMPCKKAIESIILLYFQFLNDNPTYVNILLWENLNKGKYIEEIDSRDIKDNTLEFLRRIINKGKQEGTFKESIDTEQVILSLLTYTFSYFSNRFTLSKLFGKKLDEEENIKKRSADVTEMFLGYLCVKD